MNTLIVLAHPEPKSFNAHLAGVAREVRSAQGDHVELSDLYAADFDPREAACHFALRRDPERFDAADEQRFSWERCQLPTDVAAELAKVLAADLVILQFPLWWFGPPAILKGWMDRVFVYGGLYSSARRHDRGVCKGKRALLCVTTGSSEEACSPDGREGDTRLVLWPALYTLRYVGFTVLEPVLIHGVRSDLCDDDAHAHAHDLELARATRRYRAMLADLDAAPTVPFNSDDDWDDAGKLKPTAPVHSPFIRHPICDDPR
jgi:NAD(P)H dehydrogenase (quinone)